MKEFILKLLSPNSGVSSKRFLAIAGFFVAVGFSICSLFLPVEMTIIYSFLSLSGAGTLSVGLERK